MNYLLTICIPTFANEEVLLTNLTQMLTERPLLDDLLNIVIVDNSQISSIKLSAFSNQMSNIDYSHNVQNVGFSRNLFISLARSSGKFVMILGDDDLVRSSLLIDLINHLQEKKDKSLVFLPLPYLCSTHNKILSFPLAFMRAGTMSGIVFEKSSLDLSSMYLDDTIYPQISLAITAFNLHGASILPSHDALELGDSGLTISQRFNDKMCRPADFGCLERFDILKRANDMNQVTFKDYFISSVSLLQWAFFIANDLYSSNRPFLRKFLCRIFFCHPDKPVLLFSLLAILIMSTWKKIARPLDSDRI